MDPKYEPQKGTTLELWSLWAKTEEGGPGLVSLTVLHLIPGCPLIALLTHQKFPGRFAVHVRRFTLMLKHLR